MEDYENEEHSRNKTAFTQREKSKIMQWLHKQDISLPKGFNLDEEPITFFKDGYFKSLTNLHFLEYFYVIL